MILSTITEFDNIQSYQTIYFICDPANLVKPTFDVIYNLELNTLQVATSFICYLGLFVIIQNTTTVTEGLSFAD